jgi:hypothetical protein
LVGLAVVTVATILAFGPSIAAASTPCGSTGVFTTMGDSVGCSYTTVGADTFTAPPYQPMLTFTADGAGRGTDLDLLTTGTGGQASGTLGVTPGELFDINVGGMPTATPGDPLTGIGFNACNVGGFNGGGNAGSGTGGCGGAGASDVRTSAGGLTDRLFVGGGAGGDELAEFLGVNAQGGDGGGDSGGDGQQQQCTACVTGKGGGGGNQLGGGASPGNAGSAGFGFGGSGGPAVPSVSNSGAGGGGGYYGGGGSGSAALPGAGGGGSGYVTPLATDTELQRGFRVLGDDTGDGAVTVGWPAQPVTATVALTADHTSPVAANTLVKLTATVSTSTGVAPVGTMILTNYSKGNGTANPTAPADCPCSNIAQGSLEPDGTFSVKLNASSISFGPNHDIVAEYQDFYGAIADTSSSGLTLSVLPSDQVVSFTSTAPTNASAFGATYAVAASSTSGLPVSFSIPDSSSTVCSVSGSSVSFLAAGTCVIDADQTGSAQFNAAPTVTQQVTVAAAGSTQKITFTSTPPSGPGNGSSYKVTATGGGSGNPVVFSADPRDPSCVVSNFSDHSGGLVTFDGGGTCQIFANQAGGNGFAAAPQAEQDVIVGGIPTTVTFETTPPSNPKIGDVYTVSAHTSSGGAPALTLDATSSGCKLTGLIVTNTSNGGQRTTGTVTFTGAGSCVIDGNRTGDEPEFDDAPQVQQTITITVAAVAQAITFTTTAPNPVVGGAGYTPIADGGASGNPVTFSVDGSTTNAACSLAGGTFSFDHAGTCVIDANQAGDAGYSAAPQLQQTITVGKASQTVAFTSSAPSPAVGAADYTPSATGGPSNNAVTFSPDASTTNAACSVSGGTFHFDHAGICVIDADQAGSDDYSAAPTAQQTITVDKSQQVVAFTSAAPTGAAVTGSYTPTATGGKSGNAVTFTADAATTNSSCVVAGSSVTFLHPGTCTLDANQVGNADYLAAQQLQQTFTVGKGAQTITFAAPPTGTVGSSVVLSATGGAGSSPVVFSIDASSGAGVCKVSGVNGTTLSYLAVGSCAVDGNQAGDVNYNAAPTVTRSHLVERGQTISFGSLPNRTGRDSPFEVEAQASSKLPVTFSSATPATCSVGRPEPNTVNLLAAGVCTIAANQAGNATYNPAPTVTRSVTITKANQNVAFAPAPPRALTLANSPATLGGHADSGLPITFVSQSATVCTVSGNRLTLLTTGTCQVQIQQAGNALYNPAASVTRSITVTKADQTINFPYPNRRGSPAPFTVAAKASSGLTVTFTTTTHAVCRASGPDGATITPLAPGICTIAADQAGNAFYSAARTVRNDVFVG